MSFKINETAFVINDVHVTNGVKAWCKLNVFELNTTSKRIPEYITYANFSQNKEDEPTFTLIIENIEVDNTNVLTFQLVLDSAIFGSIVIATIFVGKKVTIDVNDSTIPLDIDTSFAISEQMRVAVEKYNEYTDRSDDLSVKFTRKCILDKQNLINDALSYILELEKSLSEQ